MKDFPKKIGWDNWGKLMCDVELFAPLVKEALTKYGLPVMPIAAGFPGTHAVFQSGDVVVKVYAPLGIPDEYAERRAYVAANGLPLIPRLYGEGVLSAGGHDWPYIIIECMPGTAVREIWGDMDEGARLNTARALAKWSNAYHAIPDPFDPGSGISTDDFIKNRAKHARTGAGELGMYPEFATRALRNLDDLCAREKPALIHADLTEDHLLIDGEKYAVIDLADSRVGFEIMDWICVWFGLMERDQTAFTEYVKSCGREWNVQTRQDMQTCVLLHGYGARIIKSAVKETGISDVDSLFPEA